MSRGGAARQGWGQSAYEWRWCGAPATPVDGCKQQGNGWVGVVPGGRGGDRVHEGWRHLCVYVCGGRGGLGDKRRQDTPHGKCAGAGGRKWARRASGRRQPAWQARRVPISRTTTSSSPAAHGLDHHVAFACKATTAGWHPLPGSARGEHDRAGQRQAGRGRRITRRVSTCHVRARWDARGDAPSPLAVS